MPASIVFCLLTLPWLNPFTFGPTPAVVPWLFATVCAAGVWGIGIATRGRIDKQLWVRVIAGAWIAAATISAAIGLVQYFGASAPLVPWVNATSLGEAFGNLRQRNQFATLMAIGLAAILWWVRHGCPWGLAGGVVTLLACGSVASSSRTGLLLWVFLIGVTALWRSERQPQVWRVLVIAALAYAMAAVALPWLAGLDPLSTGAWARLRAGDAACMGRITLWSNVLYLIAQKPWLGWGWGELDYAHFITLYPGARFCDILDNAHNLPLHLAVELGVPVALVGVAAGILMVARARPWRDRDATRQLAWAVLALIGIHSLLEYPLWYGPFQIAAGVSVWLLWRTRAAAAQSPQKWASFGLPGFAGIASAAIIFIAITGYAAWDYWRVGQLYVAPAERAPAYRDNTLNQLREVWLFRSQVQFAELTTLPLNQDNAAYAHDLARQMLHFSPEPRVVEKMIDSAVLLGREDEAAFYRARYQAAFPDAHANWVAESARNKAP